LGRSPDVDVERASIRDHITGGTALDRGNGERGQAEIVVRACKSVLVQPADVVSRPNDRIHPEMGPRGMGSATDRRHLQYEEALLREAGLEIRRLTDKRSAQSRKMRPEILKPIISAAGLL